MSELQMHGPITAAVAGAIASDENVARRVADALAGGIPTLTTAVRVALAQLGGEYTVVITSADAPGEAFVARSGMPLLVGERDEGEVAVLRRDGVVIRRIEDGRVVVRPAPVLALAEPEAA